METQQVGQEAFGNYKLQEGSKSKIETQSRFENSQLRFDETQSRFEETQPTFEATKSKLDETKPKFEGTKSKYQEETKSKVPSNDVMTASLISVTSSLNSPIDSGIQLLDSESEITSVMSNSCDIDTLPTLESEETGEVCQGDGKICQESKVKLEDDLVMNTSIKQSDSGTDLKEYDWDVKGGDLDLKECDLHLKEDDFDLKEGDLDLKEGDLDLKGGDLDLKKGNLDFKRCDLYLKGCDLDTKEGSLDFQISDLNTQENVLDPKGSGLSVKTVDKNLSLDEDGCDSGWNTNEKWEMCLRQKSTCNSKASENDYDSKHPSKHDSREHNNPVLLKPSPNTSHSTQEGLHKTRPKCIEKVDVKIKYTDTGLSPASPAYVDSKIRDRHVMTKSDIANQNTTHVVDITNYSTSAPTMEFLQSYMAARKKIPDKEEQEEINYVNDDVIEIVKSERSSDDLLSEESTRCDTESIKYDSESIKYDAESIRYDTENTRYDPDNRRYDAENIKFDSEDPNFDAENQNFDTDKYETDSTKNDTETDLMNVSLNSYELLDYTMHNINLSPDPPEVDVMHVSMSEEVNENLKLTSSDAMNLQPVEEMLNEEFRILGVGAPANRAQAEDLQTNGLQANGLQVNGLQANGLQTDGLQANGLHAVELQALGLQPIEVQPIEVQEIQVDETQVVKDTPQEEQIVFRRQRKKKNKSDTPKKRVSFHEDILNSTKIDDIHINHGFITHEPDVSMSFFQRGFIRKPDVVKGRYSWAAEGDAPYYEDTKPHREVKSDIYIHTARFSSTSSSSSASISSSIDEEDNSDEGVVKKLPALGQPKSSCLKKTKHHKKLIDTNIVEEEVKLNKKKSETNLLDTNIFGSLKNILNFSTSAPLLAERGVPEGQEDITVYSSSHDLQYSTSRRSSVANLIPKSVETYEVTPAAVKKIDPLELAKNNLKLTRSEGFYPNYPTNQNVPSNVIICDSNVYEHKGISYSYEYDNFKKTFEQEKPKSSTIYQKILKEFNFFKRKATQQETVEDKEDFEFLESGSSEMKSDEVKAEEKKEENDSRSSESTLSKYASSTRMDWSDNETVSDFMDVSSGTRHLNSPKHRVRKPNHYALQNFKLESNDIKSDISNASGISRGGMSMAGMSMAGMSAAGMSSAALSTDGMSTAGTSTAGMSLSGMSTSGMSMSSTSLASISNMSNLASMSNMAASLASLSTSSNMGNSSNANGSNINMSNSTMSNINMSNINMSNINMSNMNMSNMGSASDLIAGPSGYKSQLNLRSSSSKSSLINRFLRNVTLKKMLDIKLQKKQKNGRKYLGLYPKGMKPDWHENNELDRQIEEEIINGRGAIHCKEVQYERAIGYRLRNEVFRDRQEKLIRIFPVHSAYTTSGENKPLVVILTNTTLYLSSCNPNNSYCNHYVLPYMELNTILIGPNAQTIHISNYDNDMQCIITTGSSQITSEIMGQLEMSMRKDKNKPKLPAVKQLTMRDMVNLRKAICKQTSVHKDEEYFHYSIVNIQEYNTDISETPLGPNKEGPLMFRIPDTESRWETAYFILKAGVLYMLSSPSHRVPMRVLPLINGACQGARRMYDCPRPHTFQLLIGGTSLHLAAPDEYVASEWLQVLVHAASGTYSHKEKIIAQSCTLLMTSDNILTVREAFPCTISASRSMRPHDPIKGAQALSCAAISDITAFRLPSAEQSWCVLEFACREVHESSGDWILYFSTNTELESFISTLEMLWDYHNEQGDSFPLSTISESDPLNKKCMDSYRALQNAWPTLQINMQSF